MLIKKFHTFVDVSFFEQFHCYFFRAIVICTTGVLLSCDKPIKLAVPGAEKILISFGHVLNGCQRVGHVHSSTHDKVSHKGILLEQIHEIQTQAFLLKANVIALRAHLSNPVLKDKTQGHSLSGDALICDSQELFNIKKQNKAPDEFMKE